MRKETTEIEKENPHASLMAVSGTGLGKDGLFITFYEGFSAYTEAMSMVKQLPHIDVYSVDISWISTKKDQYGILTMSAITTHVSSMK